MYSYDIYVRVFVLLVSVDIGESHGIYNRVIIYEYVRYEMFSITTAARDLMSIRGTGGVIGATLHYYM